MKTRDHLNERYIHVNKDDFKDTCVYLYGKKRAVLRLMFATDERETEGAFNVYTVFSIPGIDRFDIVVLSRRKTTSPSPLSPRKSLQPTGMSGRYGICSASPRRDILTFEGLFSTIPFQRIPIR